MVRHTTRSRWHIEWHLQLLAYLRAALQPGALMKAAPPARTTLAQGRRVSTSQPYHSLIVVDAVALSPQ